MTAVGPGIACVPGIRRRSAGLPFQAHSMQGTGLLIELGAVRRRLRAGRRRKATANYARRSPISGLGDPGSIPGSSTWPPGAPNSEARPLEGAALRTAQRTVGMGCCYRIWMSVHDLPGGIFTPTGGRNPQIERGDVLPVTSLCPPPLCLEKRCQVGSTYSATLSKLSALPSPNFDDAKSRASEGSSRPAAGWPPGQ
jgi:hypothetical protein